MKKLGNRNYILISISLKTLGFKAVEDGLMHEEEMYISEIDEIKSFLQWCLNKQKFFGHGNYEERFAEFKAWEKDIKQKWNEMQNKSDPEAEKTWYCNDCGEGVPAKEMLIVFGGLCCPTCADGMGEKGSPAYIG